MQHQAIFSRFSSSFWIAKFNSDSRQINYSNQSATTDEEAVNLLSNSELENLHAGWKDFGYGASYHTSSYEPSIAGFVTYLFTGYINGFRFPRCWEHPQ
jgi:hypothetical protein